ncbi:MAG: PrgI family protein [Candidatus Altiarchaeota archaeon]
MAYDIPQELKYKEIFAYGMTLRQFIYVAVFGVATVMILSNKDIPKEAGAVIGLGLMGIAVLLGFFDFDIKILEFLSFLNTPKNIMFLTKEASKFLDVKYLKDSAIVLKDNTLVGVLKVDALNFSILSKEQKEAVIYNFMNFLNSLGFRAEILMRTVTMNMNQYLENMQTRASCNAEGSLAEIYSLREFLEEYVRENRVTDRVFYITLPLKNTQAGRTGYRNLDDSMAFRELEERMHVLREWLSKSMVLSTRLDNTGLLFLLGSFFTDDMKLDAGCTSPYTTYNGGENVLE